MNRTEQLYLPLGIYPNQEVRWQVAEEVRDWRRFGKKMLMMTAGVPQFVSTEVERIDELEDPQLRYALRFAAAASSMGLIEDSEFSSHGQFVSIIATDEGSKSRLLSQQYSGMGVCGDDTFMEDLRRFAPDYNEDN